MAATAEMTHTPGPWERDIDGVIRSDHTAENGFASEHICSMDHYREERKPEREANAKLIAAAPDLFAALKRIANERDRISAGREPSYVAERYDCFDDWAADVATAAIAKATP
jgi:hypothetical protein